MSEPVHVVIVGRQAGGTGSVGLVTRHHARELAAEFRVTIISETIPNEPVRGIVIQPRRFDALRRFAHAPNEVAFARAARHALFAVAESEPVDFVLCEGDVPAVLAANALKRKQGTPFGIVTHGDMGERTRETFDRRLAALYRWAEPRSARSADLIAALGPTMANFARRRGASDDAIVIVPNGIDLHDIGLEPDATPNRNFERPAIALLFASRLASEKGIVTLLDAAELLRASNVAFDLTIAGGGPLEEDVRARSAALGIDFRGPRPRNELGEMYVAADVVIAPSLSEALPLAIIEALAAGTPVIATPVGDVAEIVRDRENGLLVPPNDPGALAHAIELLARDRALLGALAERARPSVLPRFSWEETGRRLRDAIRERLRDNR